MHISEDILQAENQIESLRNKALGMKHCRFKGGTTVTNTSTYTPTEYELQLQKAQANYADAIAPNSLWLNDTARNVLENSLGTVQVDFNQLNNSAQQQIADAQAGMAGLTGTNNTALDSTNNTLASLQKGELPSAYLQNMSDAISRSMNNTIGQNLNSLANRGVVNSSVTNQALNDIESNTANALAQNYLNNISAVQGLANDQLGNTLNTTSTNGNIYNNRINNATAGITTAAAAQEAAQAPALNLWNASLGLNGSTSSALSAAAGKGTTSSTSTQKGGGGLISGLLGGLF